MKTFLFFVLLLSAFTTTAQDIKMNNGSVRVHDSVYCLYEYNHNPVDNTPLFTDSVFNPVQSFSYMSDVILSLPGSAEQLIIIRVRHYGTSARALPKRIYTVQLLPVDTQFSVELYADFIGEFVKSIVAYKLLDKGAWNDSASFELLDFWSHNPKYIPQSKINKGYVVNLNKKVAPKITIDMPEISANKNKIFYNKKSIGCYYCQYPVSMSTSHFECFIYDKDNNYVARIYTPLLSSVTYLWIKENDVVVNLNSRRRTEENLAALAARFLIAHHMFYAIPQQSGN